MSLHYHREEGDMVDIRLHIDLDQVRHYQQVLREARLPNSATKVRLGAKANLLNLDMLVTRDLWYSTVCR